MDAAESTAFAKEVVLAESKAVKGLAPLIDERFAQAVDLIYACTGRVVVTGMGKAGLIGRKVQATLASTGTPSVFLHPAEAIHGDLGMVLAGDVVLVLSNSGETEEIVRLLPYVKKIGAKVVSITATANGTLGKHSNAVLEIGKIEEACPLKLAPSASTAAMLAMGDALALTLQKARKFTVRDYVSKHPSGTLAHGLTLVTEFMRTGERCPSARSADTVEEAVHRMTRAGAGLVAILDDQGTLSGVFTDGDFRRLWADGPGAAALAQPVSDFMTQDPKRVGPETPVAEAMGIFRDQKINALPVVAADGRLVGLLDVQDIVGLRIEP